MVLKYAGLCIGLCIYSARCKAGNDNYPLGARSSGMAEASVATADIWSSANNQAGLAYLTQTAAALYYENRLNVKGLAVQAGAVAVPVKSTVIGLNYRYFGYSQYNDFKFGLAIAKKLGEKFALGVQMDYFRTRMAQEYGSFDNLCGEVGLLCEPVENLTIGAHVFNIFRNKQSANPGECIPTVMRFGAGYTIKEKATISLETEKDLRMRAIFKGGLEFVPIANLFLRCGVSTGPMNQYAFGLGYVWNRFGIDLAFCRHKFLGYSPHISLVAKL